MGTLIALTVAYWWGYQDGKQTQQLRCMTVHARAWKDTIASVNAARGEGVR